MQQTLHITVEEKNLDIFLILINNLKEGIVKNIKITKNDVLSEDKIDIDYLIDFEKRLKKNDIDLKQVTPQELFKEIGI